MRLPTNGRPATPHLHDAETVRAVRARIARLTPESERRWGVMNAAQALAHLALAMEYSLGDTTLPRHPLGRIIGGFAKRSLLVKRKPMGQGVPTHPSVLIHDERDFQVERQRLERAIDRFARGPEACTRAPHFFFGRMTPMEWADFSYIHLDHHLRQFGV